MCHYSKRSPEKQRAGIATRSSDAALDSSRVRRETITSECERCYGSSTDNGHCTRSDDFSNDAFDNVRRVLNPNSEHPVIGHTRNMIKNECSHRRMMFLVVAVVAISGVGMTFFIALVPDNVSDRTIRTHDTAFLSGMLPSTKSLRFISQFDGSDSANISSAVTGKQRQSAYAIDHKERDVSFAPLVNVGSRETEHLFQQRHRHLQLENNYGRTCFSDENCESGLYDKCIGGICKGQSSSSSSTSTSTSTSSTSDQNINNKVRVQRSGNNNFGQSCFSNRNCQSGFYDLCFEGTCSRRSDDSIGRRCIDSTQCTNQSQPFCVNGNCSSSNIGLSCVNNSDCAGGNARLCDTKSKTCTVDPNDTGGGGGGGDDDVRSGCIMPSQLQQTLDSRSSGGSIQICSFRSGSDDRSMTIVPTGSIRSARSNVTIECQHDGTSGPCILSGNRKGPVLRLTGNGVTIKNMQFSRGLAISRNAEIKGQGGALRLEGSNAKVIGCTFLGNLAQKRGGAIHSDGPVEIIDSVFLGNYAPYCANVYANGQCVHV